jgi:hypothetical protein
MVIPPNNTETYLRSRSYKRPIRSFRYFPKLPTELRIAVWKLAHTGKVVTIFERTTDFVPPLYIQLWTGHKMAVDCPPKKRLVAKCTLTPLLCVNRESRLTILSRCKPLFEGLFYSQRVPFDFENDMLRIEVPDLLENFSSPPRFMWETLYAPVYDPFGEEYCLSDNWVSPQEYRHPGLDEAKRQMREKIQNIILPVTFSAQDDLARNLTNISSLKTIFALPKKGETASKSAVLNRDVVFLQFLAAQASCELSGAILDLCREIVITWLNKTQMRKLLKGYQPKTRNRSLQNHRQPMADPPDVIKACPIVNNIPLCEDEYCLTLMERGVTRDEYRKVPGHRHIFPYTGDGLKEWVVTTRSVAEEEAINERYQSKNG